MQHLEIDTPAGPIAVLQWHDAPADAPRLHFAHATGMNANLYARMLAPLVTRFRITASDTRGHGRCRLTADPGALTGWEQFSDDLVGLLDSIDPGAPWLLAGHSLGGAVSLLAAARSPRRVAGLALIDPAALPFDVARAQRAGTPAPNPMADQAARRRADFASRAEARAAYAGRGVFKSWSDADLDAYLADGLRDTANGVTLACAPAYEAATFRAVSAHVEDALACLAIPFAIIAGEHGSTVPPAEFAAFAAHSRCVAAERLPGTTHFVPLERGDAVCAAIDLVAISAL